MKVIVCGSRDWGYIHPIRIAIGTLAANYQGLVVIHGGARGADITAGIVARGMGLQVRVELADWVGKGRGAGMERNRRMLELGPDRVLAFKDGFDYGMQRGGTENMCRIALEANVPVLLFSSATGWECLELDR